MRQSKRRRDPDFLTMTYGQIIATIQCYIHHVKGIEVAINLPRNIGEIKKMKKMYTVASEYLNS